MKTNKNPARVAKLIPCAFLSNQALKYFILIVAFSGLAVSAPVDAKVLKYLYINAGEGGASGGHTALRFDTDTFHFQHYDGGIIRLVKHASADFDYQYRYLENRTFHQAKIDLDDADYQQLWHYFNLRFLQQQQQNALLNELELNLALLRKQYQHPALSIKGAGLFNANAVPYKAEVLSIQNFRKQINQKYGVNFLENKIQHLKNQANTLQISPWPASSLQIAENSFLSVPYSFASQQLDIASKIFLLEALKKGTPLNTKHYFSPEHAYFNLSKQEIKQLTLFQKALTTNLLGLLSSQRPDWGSAGLILYARILGLTHTIHSESFVFLDSFAANSLPISTAEVAKYKRLFLAQSNQALDRLYQEKQRLFATQSGISEKQYSRFAMLGNYYHERERGLKTEHGIRVSGERHLPEKSILLPEQLFPKFSRQQTENEINRLEKYRQQLTQQLQSLYRYDLLSRNCVTEIFSILTHAQINNKQIATLQLISKNSGTFIPYKAFEHVAAHFPTEILPSYRQQQLHKMYAQESAARVYLREFNTLSAKNYKYNDQDAAFVFFTDDKPLLRPLFGAANLLTATATILYGSFTFPLDSGKTLHSGMMGILMSLPELAFFNIRKGSYKYLIPSVQTE